MPPVEHPNQSTDAEFLRAQDLPPALAARTRRRARWEALTVSALLLIVSVAAIWGLWTMSRRNEEDAFRRYVSTLAEVAASQVDPELHGRLRRPEQLNDPDYVRAVAPLRALLRTVPDIHYAYTLVWDGKDLRVVLDSADPGAVASDGGGDQAGLWQRFDIDDPVLQLEVLGVAGHRKPTTLTTPTLVTDRWGTFLSAFAPIFDARGHAVACAGVAVNATIYLERLRAARIRALLGLLPAGVLIVLLGMGFYWVRSRGLMMESLLVDAAQKDKLTGLPNRRVFMERLRQALARARTAEGTRLAVLFVDFDRFKLVNDSMGHEAGDELLCQISRRLLQHAQHAPDGLSDTQLPEIVVSRFGGDEFLILSADPKCEPRAWAQGLLQRLAAPYYVAGTQIHSMASIGLVTSEQGEMSAEEFLRYADVAMYEAKRRGRGCCVEFDEAMRAHLGRQSNIEAALRRAVGTSELYLEYQPVIDLRTRARVCVEALLRWHHPVLGPIPPAEFLPIAEEAGLMGLLGGWVLQESCRAMAAWRLQDPGGAPGRICVNVSRTQLAHDKHLFTQVKTALQRAGLPPSCLQLEFAEHDIARDPNTVGELLSQLHDLGVKLAMDAFGSATSAITLLRKHPFDIVNINRALLAGLKPGPVDEPLVRATLRLIETLGMVSVAHGIEDVAQLVLMESAGCAYAQGHTLGVPVPFERVMESAGMPPSYDLSAVPDLAPSRQALSKA